jgi:hypothetical protein
MRVARNFYSIMLGKPKPSPSPLKSRRIDLGDNPVRNYCQVVEKTMASDNKPLNVRPTAHPSFQYFVLTRDSEHILRSSPREGFNPCSVCFARPYLVFPQPVIKLIKGGG